MVLVQKYIFFYDGFFSVNLAISNNF